MPKRKKISLASEDSKDGSECSKQRKFLDPLEMCHELYETIRNHKADDGRLICESFIRTPNRRSLPDYYDIVTSPIDLMKIQQKLKTDEYIDVNQFTVDIELMVNNAKSYYKKSSQEYKDASEIWEIFVETKNELLSAEHRAKEEDKSSEIDDDRGSECSEDESAYEELFTTVMTAADMEGRPLSTMFQLLPSRTTCDLAMTSEEQDPGQENETYHFKILVPSVAAGAIIGKGGETISQLQNEAGAKVKMSKATEFYPGTKERVCLITGSVEGILRILHFIMEKVKEKPDVNAKMAIDFDHNQPVEREKQVKILVPNNTAGMIIGKGGSYIKQIKKESGSYVQISQKYKDHALAERCITVIGEMENNKIACYMILSKIIEDPQSGSCLNVSYADVTGPVANSNPTGSPFAHPHCVPSDAANSSNTNCSSTDSLNSLSPTTSNNFLSSQPSATHSGNLPFIGIGMEGFPTPPTNVTEVIETTETMLRGSGYSEQAVSEISAAMNTLANYGMLGLGIFNGVNDDPVVSSGLRMEMPNSATMSCPIPPVGIANQGMYDIGVPGMEAACNFMVASGPIEARSNMMSLTCSLGNRMSELSLEQRFISPTISNSKDQYLLQAETAVFEPFGRTSPTLASPSAAALPLNNNSFGLGTGLSSDPSILRKSPISSDPQTSDAAKVEIKVKENIVRAILGPGGRDLENIQRFSKANIQISKKRIFAPGACDHVITITGLSKAVNTAQYLIKRQIAEEEAKRA